MNSSYIMLSIIGILSIIILILIIPNQEDKESLDVSNCSLELDTDKGSNIKLPGGLYSGRTFDINVYYCKVEGFDEIRLVEESSKESTEFIKIPNSYEFVLKQGKKASITFLVEINEYFEPYGKKVEGIKALMYDEKTLDIRSYFTKIALYNYSNAWIDYRFITFEDYSKVKIYLSDMDIISDKSVIVTYTFEADKEAREATYEVSLMPATPMYHQGLFLSIGRAYQ
ncbi:MAG: hypothetical protein KatS3mg003_1296 [Candidatus Nitrosocaldaceae archaeon]|nr:MAG: hypothetical protein KatS3mg003_1296 [Candidatus Nitrosocaldaceae archaeon]